MANAKGKTLWVAALAIALISGALQIVVTAAMWWDFDPRLSCDRLPFWDEWLACIHGQSHRHIFVAEVSIAIWLVGGVAMALGRFVPPYISVVVPAGLAALFVWSIVRHWHETFRPRTDPVLSPSDIFNYATTIGVLAFVLLGPVAAAWLFGLHNRTRRGLSRFSAVFE